MTTTIDSQRDELVELLSAAVPHLHEYADPFGEIADVILDAGYIKSDHIEYAADHKHAGLDFSDEDGELFTDREGIEWVYEDYANVTLMQRHVGLWTPLDGEAA